jgi:hypothetical protein
MAEPATAVTLLLRAWHAGDATVSYWLTPQVDADLRRRVRYSVSDWQMARLWLCRELGRRKAGR